MGIMLVFPVSQGSATIIWSEDFEDKTLEDLDDWILNAYEIIAGIAYTLNDSGCSLIDGILRAPNYPFYNDTSRNKTDAIHNTTVAYGTWNFDWVPPATLTQLAFFDYINFIFDTEGITNFDGLSDVPCTGYSLDIINFPGGSSNIELTKSVGGTETTLGSYNLSPPFNKPIHFNITRDQQGHFKVYYDTELIIQATDNDINTSFIFTWNSFIGDTGLDNITVSENTMTTTTAVTESFIVWLLFPSLMILVVIRRKR
jgi:hypothetical protein